MEDVAQSNLLYIMSRYLLMLALMLMISTSLNAATQGNVGRGSSQGSISITLDIPESTRLLVKKNKSLHTGNSDICLDVLDTVMRSSINFYNIAGLDGSIAASYDVGSTNYENLAQFIELENQYQNSTSEPGCTHRTRLERVNDDQSAVLLILIVE